MNLPPDPACDPRPVANQEVAILDGDREIARGASDGAGRITFSLPHGRYTIHPLAAASGFPSPPADQVVDVGAEPIELPMEFDTGIR